MKQRIGISFLMIFSILVSYAQKAEETDHNGHHHGIEKSEHWKKVKRADNLMVQHSYYNAIDLYREVDKEIPSNEYLQHVLANAYFLARDYANAEKYYQKATAHDFHDKEYPMDRFEYAETLKMNGKYDAAILQFQTFMKKNRRVRTGEMKYWMKIVSNEVKSCNFAKSVVADDPTFHKVNFIDGDINHAYTDFSPNPQGTDKLYFASLRQDSVVGYNKNEDAYFPVKLYSSEKQGNEWGEPKELPFNHPFEHTANLIFNHDESRAYFTRCYQDRHNKVVCNIFYSDKDTLTGKWKPAHKAGGGVNSGSHTSTQPAIQHIKKKRRRTYVEYDVLYFVSDRPNGVGGKDIWFTQVNGNKFSTPTNCGKRINTLRDEMTPNYDQETNEMTFSSNYHWGMGGFDLFKTKGYEKRFSRPQHLGVPINSSYDDTYYALVDEKVDSLEYGYIVSNRPGGIALTSETCCDDIYEFQEYIPEYFDVKGLVQEQIITQADTTSAKEGPALAMVDSSLVALPDTIPSKEPKVETIKMSGVKVGYVRKKNIEAVKEDGLKPTIANLQEYIVWVEDSTDQTGEFETKLIKGRKYSLVVQKEGKVGKVLDLDSLANTTDLTQIEVNLKDKVIKVDTTKAVEPKTIAFEQREKLTVNTDVSDLKKDEKLVLENMYFDTNKDKIKASSKSSLDLLLSIMQNNKGIKIEISGHTDARGNDDYNMDLSQRRAESVMDFLIENGVAENRLVAKGYGETEPIAPNENKDGSDNPEGRKLNRRTEIKILANKK